MSTLTQDLSYSLRSMRKAPAFAAVAIVTLDPVRSLAHE